MRHKYFSMYKLLLFLLFIPATVLSQPYVQVLGIAQDGGYPHVGCKKECCRHAIADVYHKTYVVSLALLDPESHKWWLFEATPDIKEQLREFHSRNAGTYPYLPEGIFLSHAHMGHYTGLMQFGREALGTKGLKVYAMPKMKQFLEKNGPWSQLVSLNNIEIIPIEDNSIVGLNKVINIVPFVVPHRDEYSETAGFRINTSNKKYMFIPDINKWNIWEQDLIENIKAVDIVMIDATFYDDGELPGKNMKEIPHPFVTETIGLLDNESAATKSKVYFIHMNHTNPLLWDNAVQQQVVDKGYNITKQWQEL